jgi:hypothetical protein
MIKSNSNKKEKKLELLAQGYGGRPAAMIEKGTSMCLKEDRVTTDDKIARQTLSRMAEVFLTDNDAESVMAAIASLTENYNLRKRMAYIVRDYCSQHLRPELSKFAGLMEMKLIKHDPARGHAWKSGNMQNHLARIRAILEELEQAVATGRKIGIKAADLANHAMMLADNAGDLKDV